MPDYNPGVLRSRILLLILALVLALAAPAATGEMGDAVTYLGRNMLPRTDLVVLGQSVNTPRVGGGVALGTLRIDEVLLGREDREKVLLLSSDPSFFPVRHVPAVMFLGRLGAGRYEPLGRMDLRGAEARTKLETLRKYLEIESMKGAAAKRKALRDLLMKNLVSGDRFLIWSAARELAHFSERERSSLTEQDAGTIRTMAASTSDPILTELLLTTLKNVGSVQEPATEKARPEPSPRKLPPHPEFKALEAAWNEKGSGPDRRKAILQAIAARHLKHAGPILLMALEDVDAGVREVAALNLGEAGLEKARGPLLALLSREKRKRVLLAAIQALGILGDPSSLDAILVFGKDPELLRAVAFAAARIGGDSATDYIRGMKATHSGTEDRDREYRKLADFLLSDAFKTQEATMAKIRQRRLR